MCLCYLRLPAGPYLTMSSRLEGVLASTAPTRAQRSAHHRRAHQVGAETMPTGGCLNARVRAAPPVRRPGSRATSGHTPRARSHRQHQERWTCTHCRKLVAHYNVQVGTSAGSDTLYQRVRIRVYCLYGPGARALLTSNFSWGPPMKCIVTFSLHIVDLLSAPCCRRPPFDNGPYLHAPG